MHARTGKQRRHPPEPLPPAQYRGDDPSRTGDPSNPQGSFWKPEDRYRGEEFLKLPLPFEPRPDTTPPDSGQRAS